MASARNLRREASTLLKLTKEAFKFIRDNTSPSEERDRLLEEMHACIDRADPPTFDVNVATLLLTMTNPTADSLLALFKDPETGCAELAAAFANGMRRTEQRVYVRLDLNHTLLEPLYFALTHKVPNLKAKAYRRLAIDVEKALKRNPMEILGSMGL